MCGRYQSSSSTRNFFPLFSEVINLETRTAHERPIESSRVLNDHSGARGDEIQSNYDLQHIQNEKLKQRKFSNVQFIASSTRLGLRWNDSNITRARNETGFLLINCSLVLFAMPQRMEIINLTIEINDFSIQRELRPQAISRWLALFAP